MPAGGFSLRHLFITDDPSTATLASGADIDAMLKDALPPASPSPADITMSPPAGTQDTQNLILPEGIEFTSIYAQAGITAVAFSIEKLAKLVDGLNHLDAATKKTAVAAMDAADDSWDISSVITDGKAKRAALIAYQNSVSSAASTISVEITRRLDANQADKAHRLADFDQQITALQSQREKAITDAASVAATLRAQATAAAEASERERNRISNTIHDFDSLITLFDAAPSVTSA
jgi:hypothetical protein